MRNLINRLESLEESLCEPIKYPPFAMFFKTNGENKQWMLANNVNANQSELQRVLNSMRTLEDMYE